MIVDGIDLEFEVHLEGAGFCEGPVWLADGGIAFTAIDRGQVCVIAPSGRMRWIANVGGGPNGLVEASDGSLYIAQNGGRGPGHPFPTQSGGVQVVHPDGGVRWVTMDPISPNDLCFGPDGALYVTDPTRRPQRDDGRLWKVEPDSGRSTLLCSLAWYPNGIGFDNEDRFMYLASTGDRKIIRFPWSESGLGEPEMFSRAPRGMPDGLAFDAEGNLAVCCVSHGDKPGGIYLWSPDGELIQSVPLETGSDCTNLAIAPDGTVLVTDSGTGRLLLSRQRWRLGALLHPFRPSTISQIPREPATEI